MGASNNTAGPQPAMEQSIGIGVFVEQDAVVLKFESGGMQVWVPLNADAAIRIAGAMKHAASKIKATEITVVPASALGGPLAVNRRIVPG